MTQKPELGTCRTHGNVPHEAWRQCWGWQALPPSPDGGCENCNTEKGCKIHGTSQKVVLTVEEAQALDDGAKVVGGESGAGTVRDRAWQYAEKHVIPSWRKSVANLLADFSGTEVNAALDRAAEIMQEELKNYAFATEARNAVLRLASAIEKLKEE